MATDWQVAIDDLLMGAGTDYQLTTGPDGLGLPAVRSSDTPRPLDHGLFLGADFLGARRLTLEVALLGSSPAAASALMDALTARWQPPEGQASVATLEVRLPGQVSRILYGRPRRLSYDTGLLRSGMVAAVLEFEAGDPRLYDATAQQVTTTLPLVVGGRTYNLTFDRTYPAGAGGGTILAVNNGNWPSRPVATILGPVTDPRVENVTTGESLVFTYTLPADRTLIVDFDRRTVLEGGTSSRYYALDTGSRWWSLQPGTNEVRFRAAAYDPDARLTLEWRSAWL